MAVGSVAASAAVGVASIQGQAAPESWLGWLFLQPFALWGPVALSVLFFYVALREGEWFRCLAWRALPWLVPMPRANIVISTDYPLEIPAQGEITLIAWQNMSMPTERGAVTIRDRSLHLRLEGAGGRTQSERRREIRFHQ
jgi:hypothetical protein